MNIELIKRDQDSLLKGFITSGTEFNKKRARLLLEELQDIITEVPGAEDKAALEEILDTIWMPSQKEWTKNIKWLVTESTTKGAVRAEKEIQQLMKKFAADLGQESFTNVLPVKALEYIDAYSPIIAGVTDDTTKEALKREFRKAFEEGENVKQIMARIDNAIAIQLSPARLENIARTESIKFYTAGRVQRYTNPELDDFVQALQYDAITDARTTDICNSLDGKVVSINDRAAIAKYSPPNHYQCRATWLPVSKYEDVDIDWDPSNPHQPQPGFEAIPDLFGGAPAARSTAVKDPTKMSVAQVKKLKDEDWDALDDNVFKANIGKLKDDERRIDLSIKRAEKMFKERAGFTTQERVVPNIQAIHNRFGMSYVVDGRQTVVQIGDDKFAGQIAKAFGDGIKKGKVDIGDLIDSEVGAPWMNDIQNAQRAVNKLLEEGKEAALNFDVLSPTNMADPKAIFGNFKITHSNKSSASPSVVKARTAEIKRARKEADQWIADNFDESVFTPNFRKRKIVIDYGSNRSNAGISSINMAGGRKIETKILVHEYMHTMTFNNTRMENEIQKFFKRRTKGLKIDKINSHGEVGIKDGFYNSYIGRVYDFDKDNPKGYEVMSMGAEAMFDDPATFLAQDPDHFWFTYAMMNGLF